MEAAMFGKSWFGAWIKWALRRPVRKNSYEYQLIEKMYVDNEESMPQLLMSCDLGDALAHVPIHFLTKPRAFLGGASVTGAIVMFTAIIFAVLLLVVLVVDLINSPSARAAYTNLAVWMLTVAFFVVIIGTPRLIQWLEGKRWFSLLFSRWYKSLLTVCVISLVLGSLFALLAIYTEVTHILVLYAVSAGIFLGWLIFFGVCLVRFVLGLCLLIIAAKEIRQRRGIRPYTENRIWEKFWATPEELKALFAMMKFVYAHVCVPLKILPVKEDVK
ncbi:hypothetical protein A2801_04065 [Candidatus Woesebacteria bacterium RIFCSPHIGHO2_01_FULL_41_10]|uniref:Uncharacterized protein n=1 Tax=Candidatus Woesebacteria bacterium RIFCSPHIGHO2_01_FULL_41_10 TaxID=1802500 RepID=A0A1F7YPD1_9BACT|nr:MAG: hypothetical protein A2801_04065 [Candidatus Woesebacteria bacterium RIFCSPHIGHO2_01_FULL_41_10]